jgi:hypothetical protein
VDWDAPVLNYPPWFQMYDSWVTREITVHDLLASQRLRLAPATRCAAGIDHTRAQIARSFKCIKPATSFRQLRLRQRALRGGR